MPKRSGLGKGLDALIPAGQNIPSRDGGGITHVSVDLIQRNPRQPREKFDLEELENLAASIRAQDRVRIQECHITLGHILCEMVESDLAT